MAIAYRSSSTAASLTGTEPSGAAQGDILVAVVVNGGTISGPAGWTRVGSELVNGGWYGSMWTITRGSSAPSYAWSGSPSGPKVSIGAWSGAALVGNGSSGTAGSAVAPSVTATRANAVLVCGLTENAGGAPTAPSGMTGRLLDAKASVADESVAAGATGTRTWTGSLAFPAAYSVILEPPLPPLEDDTAERITHRVIAGAALLVTAHVGLALRAIAAAEYLPFSTLALDRELQWRMGGYVAINRELQWRMGGTVNAERTLQWRVAPSPLRVHYALTGRSGPVTYAFRFERRSIANQFLQDVTPAILGGSIEANNDRDVFRTATFTVDASALDDRGNAVTIDPLADHIAVYMDLLVDGSYTLGLPMGLFALNVPRKRYEPGSETWEIAASDNGIHLMEATTTASYTVAAAENYITGTNAVRAILDDLGLAHSLPTTTLTLPVARPWPVGTPWLRIVNDLLHAANMYSLWFDASGIARTRTTDDLSTTTPNVTYTGDDFVLIPITEEAETTRLANQVVAVVNDPGQAPLTSTKTNADPDSPISTVSLGRTITKVIPADAADQTTLDAIAENYLRNEAGWYNRVTLLTSIDPRRDAHEVYELTVDGVYAAERWWSRNWRVQLTIGAQHQHTLGKVERVVAS